MKFFREGWRSISASFIAGALFSFPASWLACVMASGALATPIANAVLGISVSFLVYSAAFSVIAKQPLTRVIFGLALKTGLEISMRGLIHVGLMTAGLTAGWASPSAQLVAGLCGHLSVPFFIKTNRPEAPQPSSGV